jgi:hypothetical protein
VTATLAPAAPAPRVGIVAVKLPADGPWIRWVWVKPGALMVGYDPNRLNRTTVELVLTEQLGAWVDIDSAEAAR